MNLRKAAILLLSLDKPVAAEVLSRLPRHKVEQVTLEMARLEDVTGEEQEAVLDEFYQLARERTTIERGGMDFAQELLQPSLGPEGAGQILENVRQSMNSVPFGFLQRIGADNIVAFIGEEHPQTIALIMSHLTPALAAEVLSGLPSNKQLEVVRRIANMEQTSPEVVRDVESTLEKRMISTFSQQMETAGGVPLVAQLPNDRTTKKGIFDNLESEDGGLVEEFRHLVFAFEDLLKLDDKSIRRLLKEVDNSQWAVALKGASDEINQKILDNLSQRAAELLREEMEDLGPVRVSDVESNQQQIVDIIRRLEDAGEVVLSIGADSEQYI